MVAATRAGRWAWGVLAVATGATTALCAAAGALLLHGDLRVLWIQPPSILFGYWITAGAWRRTGRGRYGLGPEPEEDDEPGLTAVRAARWTLVAAASMVAVLLALGIQAVIARA